MDTPLIEFKDVTKRFDSRTVLNQVNLKIYEGHITTIIGKSGVGKSVLLKHIIGLLTPEGGSIFFRGKPVKGLKKKERDEYTSQFSYMFQDNALFDAMNVFENIALPLQQTTSLSKREIKDKVMKRIEQTELSDVAYKYPSEISGGMQKRTALARALVTDPKIVLFDEPTTGQDPIRKYAILSMIAEYKKKFGFTAVLISHEIPDVLFISNRVLVLHEGKIIFQGSPEELDEFQHPIIDEFISSLVGLQDELTGLHSKQVFRSRYNVELNRKRSNDNFTVIVYTLDLHRMNENLGPTIAMEIFQSLGMFLKKSMAPFGFSTRHGRNKMVTVLPHTEVNDAEQLLDDFARELQEEKIHRIQANTSSGECFGFSVFAGLAEGKSSDDLDQIIEKAQSGQKTIARFLCRK